MDPNRVGGPSNPLLEGGGLSTVIGKTLGDGGSSFGLNRLHTRSNNPDRNLISAFKKIGSGYRALGRWGPGAGGKRIGNGCGLEGARGARRSEGVRGGGVS